MGTRPSVIAIDDRSRWFGSSVQLGRNVEERDRSPRFGVVLYRFDAVLCFVVVGTGFLVDSLSLSCFPSNERN